MNKCIYCEKLDNEVNFTSQDHVFPASIGGTFQLPVGLVCDSCNMDYFSKLELDFSRNSIISLPRQFVGPGKRGSLSPKKATSSNIHIIYNPITGEKSLGYTKLGEPFNIQQIAFKETEGEIIILNPLEGEVNEQLKNFEHALLSFSGKIKFIEDEILDEKEFYFGFHDKKYYLAATDRDVIHKINNYIQLLKNGKLVETFRSYSQNHVQVRQHLQFNVDVFNRVCGKVAYNALWYLKGEALREKKDLSDFRNWIRYGGENKFVIMLPKENDPFKGKLSFAFPKLSHRIIFKYELNGIFSAFLNLYGNFSFLIRLSKSTETNNMLTGIICDWEEQVDYKLHEYFARIS
ncbi:hypothetical protein EHQ94_06990 [Leptospira meyeri]|uniref:HNH endonuclease n=1 Tax=Leptospira meyeri TaxID=29508 RepID=UPI00108311D7|nr:HNH endonuclease [Leptospira meyeri]TGM62968.1 hypothetical protein EHQ93_11560 [Leptospira meyeri]TGM70608.1 hypothetical protein EHQ94_06990 [Leptospira meyeri]